MGMRPYVVKQGDYLTKLAHDLGFDADVVWNDDANRALRDRRPNPDVLAPGDVVQVPETVTPKRLELAVGGDNKFKAKLPKVTVAVIFKDGGEPLKGEPYVIEGLGKRVMGEVKSHGG